MRTAAVISELNPFHYGHKHLTDYIRSNIADRIFTVMSGNWVERGETAVISKFARTREALACGFDLLAELPTYWAMATAQKFAFGAVSIIENIGADILVFGSECGDIERIMKTVFTLRSPEFKSLLREKLDSGMTFARARETAVDELCGNGELLRSPNDTLAIEYIIAAKTLNSPMKYVAVKRCGAGHDSNNPEDNIASASYIRGLILNGNIDNAARFMPPESFEILKEEYNKGTVSDDRLLEKSILGTLRSGSPEYFSSLPDISEGIENRLYNAVRISSTIPELMNYASTKRYTNARLRRLIFSAYLGIKASDIPENVPYIRILGCNRNGAEILSAARKKTKIPIIMRSTCLKDNPVFMFESKATDIYALSQKNPVPCGTEFTSGIIMSDKADC